MLERACIEIAFEYQNGDEGILKAKGVALFVLVDHSGEAAKVGLAMRSTKLLIFGNPKAGTPLMLACSGQPGLIGIKYRLSCASRGREMK